MQQCFQQLSERQLRIIYLTCTACDNVCQLPPLGRWFSRGTTVSSINDHCDMTEKLLKVALNPNQTKQS